jgi:hypothetical protein
VCIVSRCRVVSCHRYKARELKSVFLNARGQFLKLVLHQCFTNRRNVYSQVALVAVNAIGAGVPRHQHPSSLSSSSSLSTSSGGFGGGGDGGEGRRQQQMAYPGQPLAAMHPDQARSVRAAAEVGSEFADAQAFDDYTVGKLKELRKAKMRALDRRVGSQGRQAGRLAGRRCSHTHTHTGSHTNAQANTQQRAGKHNNTRASTPRPIQTHTTHPGPHTCSLAHVCTQCVLVVVVVGAVVVSDVARHRSFDSTSPHLLLLLLLLLLWRLLPIRCTYVPAE